VGQHIFIIENSEVETRQTIMPEHLR